MEPHWTVPWCHTCNLPIDQEHKLRLRYRPQDMPAYYGDAPWEQQGSSFVGTGDEEMEGAGVSEVGCIRCLTFPTENEV